MRITVRATVYEGDFDATTSGTHVTALIVDRVGCKTRKRRLLS
jgi:hypothetical protein